MRSEDDGRMVGRKSVEATWIRMGLNHKGIGKPGWRHALANYGGDLAGQLSAYILLTVQTEAAETRFTVCDVMMRAYGALFCVQ